MALGLRPIASGPIAGREGSIPSPYLSGLDLTGWWSPDYPGTADWYGTPSAGPSGSRTIAAGGSNPPVGTAIAGYDPADLGTTTAGIVTPLTADDYFGTGAWSFGMYLVPTTLGVSGGVGYGEEGLFSSVGGYFGVSASLGGATIWQYDSGGSTYSEANTGAGTLVDGVPAFVQAKWTGSALSIRIDGGTWTTTPLILSKYAGDDASAIFVGRDYSGTYLLDADVPEFFMAARALSDAEFDAIWTEIDAKYATSAGAVGSLTKTLGGVTLSSAGTSTVVGTLSKTLDAVTLSSAGTTTVVGTLGKTLDDVTCSSAGTSTVVGTLSKTLDDVTCASAGTTTVLGTLSQTLGNVTLSAAGTTTVVGTLAKTLGDVTLAAIGEPGAAPVLPVPVAETDSVVWLPGTSASPVAWVSQGDAVVWLPGTSASTVAACSDATTVAPLVTQSVEVES